MSDNSLLFTINVRRIGTQIRSYPYINTHGRIAYSLIKLLAEIQHY